MAAAGVPPGPVLQNTISLSFLYGYPASVTRWAGEEPSDPMWPCTPFASMSLACRAADAVSWGLAATGPQPLAARVALIWVSTALPWSALTVARRLPTAPSASAGGAASTAPQAMMAEAYADSS